MVIRNIPKSLAESYPSLLSEFRPKWKAEVVEEDYNLYKLGFVEEIPCLFILEVTDEQLQEMFDELTEMEINVAMQDCNKWLLKAPKDMEKGEKRRIFYKMKKAEERYWKYAPLEGLYWTNQFEKQDL